jgi:uncharacterized membrane protein (DUF485 family)
MWCIVHGEKKRQTKDFTGNIRRVYTSQSSCLFYTFKRATTVLDISFKPLFFLAQYWPNVLRGNKSLFFSFILSFCYTALYIRIDAKTVHHIFMCL